MQTSGAAQKCCQWLDRDIFPFLQMPKIWEQNHLKFFNSYCFLRTYCATSAIDSSATIFNVIILGYFVANDTKIHSVLGLADLKGNIQRKLELVKNHLDLKLLDNSIWRIWPSVNRESIHFLTHIHQDIEVSTRIALRSLVHQENEHHENNSDKKIALVSKRAYWSCNAKTSYKQSSGKLDKKSWK